MGKEIRTFSKSQDYLNEFCILSIFSQINLRVFKIVSALNLKNKHGRCGWISIKQLIQMKIKSIKQFLAKIFISKYLKKVMA